MTDEANKEMLRGYIDGFKAHGSSTPPPNRSTAYTHGWLNGRDDRLKSPRDRAPVIRARAHLILENAKC